jgi:hypothetical protein
MAVIGKGEGGLRSPLVSRVQGAKMGVLNDKRDFLHTKDFKIRKRIKGNTIIASLVYSLRVGNFSYPAPDAKKRTGSVTVNSRVHLGFIIKLHLLRAALLVRNSEILHKVGSTPNHTTFLASLDHKLIILRALLLRSK